MAEHADFGELAEPFRREVLLFCYRMLGSFQDAEDAVQEVFLKAWRGLGSFDGRASFRTWLHRIAANTCLDLLKSRRRRILPSDVARPIVSRTEKDDWGEPAWDLPWLDPYPDALLPDADPAAQVQLRESVRLAFIRALQLLPPRQRAVLVLSDVLDWPSREVASTLQTSVAAVNSALQRARATTSRSTFADGGQVLEDMRLDDHKEVIASKFVDAWEQGDVDELLSLLSDDAIQMMPPMLAWFQGQAALRDAYALAWDRNPRPGIHRVLPVALNGELGFASYYRPSGVGDFDALDLTVIALNKDGKIRELTSFVQPKLFAKFGLPERLS